MRTSQMETQPTFGTDFANVGCTRAREVGRLVFSFSSRGPLRRKRAHQRLCWRGSSRLGVFGGCERRLMPPCSPPSRNLWLISSSFSSVRAWAYRDRYMGMARGRPTTRPVVPLPIAHLDGGLLHRAIAHARPAVCAQANRRGDVNELQRRRACAGERAAAASTRASVESRQSGVEVRVARGRGGSKSTVRAHGLRAEQRRSRPTWSRWCIRRRHRPAASLSAAGSAGMLTDMATARSIHEQANIYVR